MIENPLENAVAAAVENTPPPTEVSTESNTNEAAEAAVKTTETTPQNNQQEVTPTEAPNEEEVKNALNVYRMLNDPNSAPHIVRMLSERFGLTSQPPQPKVEEKPKAEPTIGDIIANSMGEEYAFLAPKIAAGVEAAINAKLTPIQTENRTNQIRSEFNSAVQELNSETKGEYSKYENKVSDLMNTLKIAPGVPIKAYLTQLYTLAKSGSPVASTPNSQKVIERIQRNAQEALPPPSAASESRVVKGPALPTVDEAVRAALRGERFE